MESTQQPKKQPQPSIHLTHRERQVARLVAKGHSDKIIAVKLESSIWTVREHLRRSYAKLGVTTRAAMIAKLPPEDLIEEMEEPKPEPEN